MKRSEAILAGCKKAPNKITMRLIDGHGGACVMGAAMLGARMTRKAIGSFNNYNIRRLRVICPREIDAIVDRNNNTDATREAIAADLALKGY